MSAESAAGGAAQTATQLPTTGDGRMDAPVRVALALAAALAGVGPRLARPAGRLALLGLAGRLALLGLAYAGLLAAALAGVGPRRAKPPRGRALAAPASGLVLRRAQRYASSRA